MSRIAFFALALFVAYAFTGFIEAQSSHPQVRKVIPRERIRYRTTIEQLSAELVRQAEDISRTSYDYFMGWNGEINRQEQLVLFRSEEFAACCRLFWKLQNDQHDYFRSESLRTNLYNAHRYVKEAFHELERQMNRLGFREGFKSRRRDGLSYDLRHRPGASGSQWSLRECRRLIDRIEAEFRNWRR